MALVNPPPEFLVEEFDVDLQDLQDYLADIPDNQIIYYEDLPPLILPDQPILVPEEVLENVFGKDKAFYKQFSLRELAYITNSQEISHAYAHSIIQSGTVNPLDYSGRIWKYEDYQRRPTSFSSNEILSVIKDYEGYTMVDFAVMVNSKQAFGNDKARYIMFKLGIYDLATWNDLTGHLGKGSKFMDQVGTNISNVISGATSFITDIVGSVGAGIFKGIFGEDWQKKLILYGSIAVAAIIGILILYFYSKTYISTKAKKRAE